MKYLIIFILINQYMFSQSVEDSTRLQQNEDLLSNDYFIYDLIFIDSKYCSCIDTIIGNIPLKEGEFWFIDFITVNDYDSVLILSLTKIEMFINKNVQNNFKNQAFECKDKLVLARNVPDFTTIIKEKKILFDNTEMFLVFKDYPYWIFILNGGQISLLKRVSFR